MKSKFISIITALCFLFSFTFAPAVRAAADTAGQEHRTGNEAVVKAAPAQTVAGLPAFALPATEGRVTAVKDFNSPTVVIAVQDLHCNPDVQRNICRILDSLRGACSEPGRPAAPLRVFVEGGYGKVDTSWIDTLPDGKLRSQVMEALVNNGRLTGAEYWAMRQAPGPRETSPDAPVLFGLDDAPVHQANIVRLGRILDRQPAFSTMLAALSRDLEFMQTRYMSARSKRFNRLVARYRSGAMDAQQYYRRLFRYVDEINAHPRDYRPLLPLLRKNYPAVAAYIRAGEMQRQVRHRRVLRETGSFVRRLRSTLPYREYAALASATADFSRLDLLASSLAAAPDARAERSLERFPALRQYLAYLALSARMNPLELIREERLLTADLRSALSTSAEEREVSFLVDFFDTFADYVRTNLSAEGYAYFAPRFEKFTSLWGKYAYKNHVPDCAADYPLLDEYYRVNEERNTTFVRKMLGDNARPGRPAQNIVVAVAGGFHTEGLTRLLSERRISSITITPAIPGDTGRSTAAHRRLIREQEGLFDRQALAAANLGSLSPRVDVSGDTITIAVGDQTITCRLKDGKVEDIQDALARIDGSPERFAGLPGESISLRHFKNEVAFILGAVNIGANCLNPVAVVEGMHGVVRAVGEWCAELGITESPGLIWAIANDPEVQKELEQSGSSLEEVARFSRYFQKHAADHARNKAALSEMRERGGLIAALAAVPGFGQALVAAYHPPALRWIEQLQAAETSRQMLDAVELFATELWQLGFSVRDIRELIFQNMSPVIEQKMHERGASPAGVLSYDELPGQTNEERLRTAKDLLAHGYLEPDRSVDLLRLRAASYDQFRHVKFKVSGKAKALQAPEGLADLGKRYSPSRLADIYHAFKRPCVVSEDMLLSNMVFSFYDGKEIWGVEINELDMAEAYVLPFEQKKGYFPDAYEVQLNRPEEADGPPIVLMLFGETRSFLDRLNEMINMEYDIAGLCQDGIDPKRIVIMPMIDKAALDPGKLAERIGALPDINNGNIYMACAKTDGSGMAETVNALRSRGITAPITVGGYDASIQREALLPKLPGVDSLIAGRAEGVLPKIVRKGHDLDNVFLRENGTVRMPPRIIRPPMQKNRLWPVRVFTFDSDLTMFEGGIPLSTSDGCWGECSFCSHRMVSLLKFGGDKVVSRTPVDIVDEMEYLTKRGKRSFDFVDNHMFGHGITKAEMLAVEIVRRRMKVAYQGLSRLENFYLPNNPERVDRAFRMLQRSGCKGLFFGLESLNVTMLSGLLKKTDNPEMYLNAQRLIREKAKKYGLFIRFGYILAGPDTEFADVLDSIRQLRETGVWQHVDIPQNRVGLYYGTDLWEKYDALRPFSRNYRFTDPRTELFMQYAERISSEIFAKRRHIQKLDALQELNGPNTFTGSLARRVQHDIHETNITTLARLGDLIEQTPGDELERIRPQLEEATRGCLDRIERTLTEGDAVSYAYDGRTLFSSAELLRKTLAMITDPATYGLTAEVPAQAVKRIAVVWQITSDLGKAMHDYEEYAETVDREGRAAFRVFVTGELPARWDPGRETIVNLGQIPGGAAMWGAVEDGQVVVYCHDPARAAKALNDRVSGRSRDIGIRLKELFTRAIEEQQGIRVDLDAAGFEREGVYIQPRREGATAAYSYDDDGRILVTLPENDHAGVLDNAAILRTVALSKGDHAAMRNSTLMYFDGEADAETSVETFLALQGRQVIVDGVARAAKLQQALDRLQRERREALGVRVFAMAGSPASLAEAEEQGIAGCVLRSGGSLQLFDFAYPGQEGLKAALIEGTTLDELKQALAANTAPCRIVRISGIATALRSAPSLNDLLEKTGLLELLGTGLASFMGKHAYSERYVRDAVYGFDRREFTEHRDELCASWLEKLRKDCGDRADLEACFAGAVKERTALEAYLDTTGKKGYAEKLSPAHRQMLGRAYAAVVDHETADTTVAFDTHDFSEAGILKAYRSVLARPNGAALTAFMDMLDLFDLQNIDLRNAIPQTDINAIAAILKAA